MCTPVSSDMLSRSALVAEALIHAHGAAAIRPAATAPRRAFDLGNRIRLEQIELVASSLLFYNNNKSVNLAICYS